MAKVKQAPPEEVTARYRRHDEVESNPLSRDLFSNNRPALDERQRQIVHDLETQGYSTTTVAELFSAAVWDRLTADARDFTVSMETLYANGPVPKAPKPGRPGKPSKQPGKGKFPMSRRYRKIPPDVNSEWLQIGASERILDIVNTYLGMWSKLTYVDQWYTPPLGPAADRLGSNRWHRDYNDQHLVKVFVYLVDVDEGTGPFEYVPGSARHGPYADEWPWNPVAETYPPPDEFARRIPSDAVRTFTAPAGSMIFCNTSGFHRGGFATEKPRSLLVCNYCSPAGLEALVDRNFDVSGAVDAFPQVARFALT